ncbi:MAG: undecaprenyl/decaprenyl-phosphate alpha-N-acetylglucosaminyl 1-phosphate transferase [Syntrophomonadaceae bacterium]|nr:undecaprenyl/decaprenyl-phosphate alpha-N-acetylglucosaminyl 1-phosphate transferase [Syntrophomonadaceae bacterium]
MPLVSRLAFRIGAVDKPDARKVHDQPMPRLGGLGIFIAFVLAILVAVDIDRSLTGILLGGSLIFLVGVLDDIYDLSPWVKLGAQICGALIAVYFGVRVHVMTNPFDGMLQLGAMSIPLTILWIIGVTNAVNLIDGLDGLAAGVCVIAAITVGIVAWQGDQIAVAFVCVLLAAAIGGFLPHNFHPARIFMGDSGSMFLGFVLSCLSIAGLAKGATLISLFVPVLILGIPVFDTLFAIVRRVNNQAPIFSPDKAHLHHRMIVMGLIHQGTVMAIYGISDMLGCAAVIMTNVTSPKAILILGLVMVLMVIGAGRIGIVSGKTTKTHIPAERGITKDA